MDDINVLTKSPLPLFSSQFLLSIVGRKREGHFKDKSVLLNTEISRAPMMGSTVEEDEISDIPAYNRANGIMWLAYSLVFWVSTVLGMLSMDISGVVLAIGCLGGLPILVFTYKKIYNKYKSR